MSAPAKHSEPAIDCDNPSSRDDFETMPDDGRRYQVVAGSVGNHQHGDIITAKQLGLGAGIIRLLNPALGAIVRVADHVLPSSALPPPVVIPPPPTVPASLAEGQIREGQTFPVADPAFKAAIEPVKPTA